MRSVVYVSGAPGSGKSTLAGCLSQRRGMTLLSTDGIKERLFVSLPPDGTDELTWSRTVGAAAMELMWQLAQQPAPVMLEANFRPRSELERSRLAALEERGARLLEVHCACPAQLARERYAARALTPARDRVVHPLTELSEEMLAEFDRPVGLGDLLVVDTARPVEVDVLAGNVRDWLAP